MRDDEQMQVLADLVASVGDAIYVLQADESGDLGEMRLVLANPATATMWAVPVENLVGRTLAEAMPGVPDTSRLAVYDAIARGGAPRDLGDVVYGPPGSGLPTYAVRAYPLPGRRVGVVCTEVTAQRIEEARAVHVLDSMSDAFYSLDTEWRFTSVNAAAERLTGRTRAELLGRNIWELFPAAQTMPFREAFLRAAASGTPATVEQRFAHFDRWVTFRIYPTSEGLAVFAQDVTERKRIEERLRQSQKMEAVSALAGGIAHDFNNALTAIRAAAGLALEGLEDDARRDVEQIEVVAEHAASLTQQLLTISRTRVEKVEPTALGTMLETSAEILASLVGDDVTLTMELDATEDTVLVDPVQLQQVILNLTLNARDAMPDGGTLRFRTSNPVDASDGDGTRDGPGSSGPVVVLEVSDTGTGMDEDAQRRAFEPFFTTKSDGAGLGLASVYGIVTQAGGRVEVRSARDAGTTFTIVLDAVADRSPGTAKTAATRVRGGECTILVVEDDEQVRPLVVRALTRLGYTVLEASSGAEAIASAERSVRGIDLLLTDVVMPGMSGGVLAATLRAARPALRVLYMSGYPADALVHRGVQDESADFIQKPFRTDALATKVRAVLDADATTTPASTAPAPA